jgi:ornithine decarboxylase
VEIVAEPGRYFASACMTLAANVVSRRERTVTAVDATGQEVETDDRSFLYYISDGVYGSFNCIVRVPSSHPHR